MKVAEVTYTGRTNQKRHRGPSGKKYRFSESPVEVESLGDARHFKSRPNFDVEYTARGRLMMLVDGEAESVEEQIEAIDYQVKRKMVSSLDITVESQESEVLEEGLKAAAEDLRKYMENQ